MIERNAGYELNEGREPVQDEQDWLRAQQDEQDWLRAQQGASHGGGRSMIYAAPVSYASMGGNAGGITRGLLKVYKS
ncbi:MAG TPA: hypothetical protein VMI32_12770 [Candidatus Solibacter sp.]|nr:hypothetical protein [Candidatus Solibacter sp.]